MTEQPVVTLVEPTGLQLQDWGNGIIVKCRTAPSGDITLGIQADNAVGIVMALLQAIASAEQLRQQRREQLGQELDPEPGVSWPLTGVQIRTLPSTRGVALVPHLNGTAIPIHLTIEQSRQIAESLLKHADQVEREAPASQ